MSVSKMQKNQLLVETAREAQTLKIKYTELQDQLNRTKMKWALAEEKLVNLLNEPGTVVISENNGSSTITFTPATSIVKRGRGPGKKKRSKPNFIKDEYGSNNRSRISKYLSQHPERNMSAVTIGKILGILPHSVTAIMSALVREKGTKIHRSSPGMFVYSEQPPVTTNGTTT